MVTVKLLKPYCIKTDLDYIHVFLEQEHFTISIENETYHFVPTKAKEFVINRRTKKIENLDAIFAFRKDNKIFSLSMNELIGLPDFLIKLYFIAKPHLANDKAKAMDDKIDIIMDELEQQNVKRLIDKALDERNEEAFYDLIALL
ncbi:IDEAL domain-containing protein [Ornithinibacillus xuwenensis]|uniref:IDEAL domain-containing protein n=1 Tax=Ornithinibacillus xuwenensis TaxID=3144668 RepID=A0ABU9XK90_9BACI